LSHEESRKASRPLLLKAQCYELTAQSWGSL